MKPSTPAIGSLTKIIIEQMNSPVTTDKESFINDLLFIRDNKVLSVNPEQSFSPDETFQYGDELVKEILTQIKQSEYTPPILSDIIDQYLNRVND